MSLIESNINDGCAQLVSLLISLCIETHDIENFHQFRQTTCSLKSSKLDLLKKTGYCKIPIFLGGDIKVKLNTTEGK